MSLHIPQTKRQRGFSLVELAVVLVIIGLLLGGLLTPLSTQMENQRRKETQDTLAAINDALVGYAAVNGELPCPDANGDGLANDNCPPGAGMPHFGTLPHATLGVSATDAWGRPWRYAVSRPFTNSAVLDINTVGNIEVWDRDSCAGTVKATALPVLVVSEGTSRLTASPRDRANIKPNPPNNCYVDAGYVMGNTGFNDLLTWVPKSVLINRMLVAGTL